MTFYLNDLGILCASGTGKQNVLQAVLSGSRAGLQASDEFTPGRELFLGRINDNLPALPQQWQVYDCRNNQLLMAAVAQIMPTIENMLNQFGAHRIGMVLGTSTSGVHNTELALAAKAQSGQTPASYHYKQQQMGAGVDFLARYLGIGGPCYTVSTACSSSGKAFLSARRLLELNLCDAVIVGGADSLCSLTVNGFAALESVSRGLCKPFGQQRDGINIGEAAALFAMSRQPGPVVLRGAAATSDAHHFSAPDPAGKAVMQAMQYAQQQAGVKPSQVDYVNLHGTATLLNDAMESRASYQLFGENTPVSSSKGMTGHTLGAATAMELGLCWLLLTSNDPHGQLIANINDDQIDPALPQLHWLHVGETLGRPIKVCQSNSFAFGGSNVSLLVGQA
jgi:3-oxoacyl-[acyl-carrier-protein] synthase-1